jgi:hypothetical protein
MTDDNPQISHANSPAAISSSNSALITPIADEALALSSKGKIPIEEEEADNVPSLPYPANVKPQFLRRATTRPQEVRQSMSSGFAGNDWAINPQKESSSVANRRSTAVASNGEAISSRKASSNSSANRGSSIFSVLPFLNSNSSLQKEEEEEDPESAFVLSRLEKSPLDGAEAASPKVWLTDQFKAALRTFNETVVGDISPGDIDWDFWQSLVENYQETVRNQPKYFTQQLAKGIPEKVRGLIWQKISKSRSERYVIMYKSLLTRSSKDEKLIIRDLSRTYPTHPYFKESNGEGQTSLFNVLKAYSIHDPDIGYCQGIAFIVGPLLLNVRLFF